jgi:hypothetical protein
VRRRPPEFLMTFRSRCSPNLLLPAGHPPAIGT